MANSTRKVFSKSLFDETDTSARAAAKLYWQSLGHTVEDHPDRYAVDLIVDTGTETFYCEVEIKKVWSGTTFKYDTLQIPERKSKFAKLDKPAYFMVFNNEVTHAFLCPSSILLSSPVVEVPNKYVYKGEMFFQVPINLISIVEIPNGN
jgi:hypothetical protein|tara:strand:+ start:340 stop:786 length:447 start_codon:yes stop_codon:yes gene_type:complete